MPAATSEIIERDLRGTVKFYNREKGWGFIGCPDGREFFVHHSDLLTRRFEELKENDQVRFDLAPGRKGLKAVNVEVE